MFKDNFCHLVKVTIFHPLYIVPFLFLICTLVKGLKILLNRSFYTQISFLPENTRCHARGVREFEKLIIVCLSGFVIH